ncbi:MAG: sodium:calcium antiporter [Acidimicrobiales bacterium]
MVTFGWIVAALAGLGAIVWGAEAFAEHLGKAAVALSVSSFALALLLAGAEPEELATGIIASARHVPALAFGDVIGANVAMCLVALSVGAFVAPLPFGPRVRRYSLLGLPLGIVCAVFVWGGHVSRLQGGVLVALYVAYVAVIWALEGSPPSIGEAGEIEEARQHAAAGRPGTRTVSKDVTIVVAGVVAMAGGGVLLVEGIRHVVHVQDTQTVVSLTIVGFATAFELVVLAWSASRRGASETVIAAVVGSFAYNATMTLGAAALVRPLGIADPGRLRLPAVLMVGSLAAAVGLAWRSSTLTRRSGCALMAGYPVFVVVAVILH